MNFDERITHIIEHNPHKIHKIIDELVAYYGDEVKDFFDCHINDEKFYNDAVKHFKNPDGTKGGHWDIETIKQKSGIDFSQKDYTCLDYAYAVNMRYSDDGLLMPIDNLFKSAQNYLEDNDYYGEPSERSYHDAKKRIEYFK